MENTSVNKQHNIFLENRKELTITGITDVGSFNEEEINISSTLGDIVIKGEKLHIDNMSIESGNIDISGYIYAIYYTREKTEKSGILGRLLR